MSVDLVIRGGTVVTGEAIYAADVGVGDGRIVAIGGTMVGRREIDASGLLLLPGAIDAHVHMAAPAGSATSVDDFETGTRAAAAGGVTTIVDFTVAAPGRRLAEDIEIRKAETASALVDVALHAEIIEWAPTRRAEVGDAVAAGVASFKFYMTYESVGQRSDAGALYDAFGAIADARGVAMVHAEDEAILRAARARLAPGAERKMVALPHCRPAIAEATAIAQATYLAERAGVALHVCHVSSRLGVEAVGRARQTGGCVTAETCPQYLVLSETVYGGADAAQFSVMPPLRTTEDCAALWESLGDGIGIVATDHCPFRTNQKQLVESFEELPYGLAGVETLLPLLYSEGVSTARIDLRTLVRLIAEEPARVFGLSKRKGRIAVGADGDLVIFDPKAEWLIDPGAMHSATDFSPYTGRAVRGAVAATLVRGEVVYERGRVVGRPGHGRFVRSRAAG